MNFFRSCFDNFYSLIKPAVFGLTKKDPETAHSLFVSFLRALYKTNMEEYILSNSSNNNLSSVKLSNAAGFNKNGEIPPSTMKYLGFDRVVIGTVTKDFWKGNPRPRTIRYPSTQSLINWMGLPGDGAKIIAERLSNYKPSLIPLTINFMSTPQKKGKELIKDLEETVLALRNVSHVDRFELNISCPNTHSQNGGIDARNEYLIQLEDMLCAVEELVYPEQELYLKVSPDINYNTIEEICSTVDGHSVNGFTIANTTTKHDGKYISRSPGKGGASGNAVYNSSLNVQKMFREIINKNYTNLKIIACGGINTTEKIEERIRHGADEIQIYTPIIFSGPGLLREFREHISELLAIG